MNEVPTLGITILILTDCDRYTKLINNINSEIYWEMYESIPYSCFFSCKLDAFLQFEVFFNI